MDRMPEPLVCFKDIVEADLRRGARLIIKIQDEIDPQWRIATPEGDWHIAVQLPNGADERKDLLRVIKNFMAWKQALSFIHVFELANEPERIMALGISPKEFCCAVSVVDHGRRPYTKANFSKIEWLPQSAIADADDWTAMLPTKPGELSTDEWWSPLSGQFWRLVKVDLVYS